MSSLLPERRGKKVRVNIVGKPKKEKSALLPEHTVQNLAIKKFDNALSTFAEFVDASDRHTIINRFITQDGKTIPGFDHLNHEILAVAYRLRQRVNPPRPQDFDRRVDEDLQKVMKAKDFSRLTNYGKALIYATIFRYINWLEGNEIP